MVKLPDDPKKLAEIRQRKSYDMFKELGDYFLTSPSVEDGLRYINGLLNEKSAYGSMTAAGYAAESMELVIRELNEREGG